MLRRIAPSLLIALAAGCGGPSADDAPSRTNAQVLVPFDRWCESWRLSCGDPYAPAPAVPRADNAWSRAQWRSFLAASKAVLDSGSDLRITRAEVDDDALRSVFDLLGVGDVLVEMRQRLDAAGLEEMRLGSGAFSLVSTRPSSYRAPSGLNVQTAATSSLRVSDRLDIAASGFSLASDGAAPDGIVSLVVSDTNLMEWKGTSDRKYIDVPIQFLIEQTLGVRLGEARPDPKPGTDVFSALLPLKEWLVSGTRELDMGPAVFQTLAQHVPELVSDTTSKATSRYVLERLTKVQSTAASRRSKLVQIEARQEIRCRVNDEAVITFASRFGVDDVSRIAAGARLRLYGIEARPLRGLVRPTISLATIDVKDDKITVYNVPVLGSYTIPIGKDSKIVCGRDG